MGTHMYGEITQRNWQIPLITLTCKKGSLIPDTSCSGEYPAMIKFFNILTNSGTDWKNTKIKNIIVMQQKPLLAKNEHSFHD